MNTVYPRPDWTFRPASKADFSERAKNVARLLEQPLQKSQEFLARLFGFQNLHTLQAEIERIESDPDLHRPGPFIDSFRLCILGMGNPAAAEKLRALGVKYVDPTDRDNHLLTATAEFCYGDPQAQRIADKHWDIREIDLFGTLDEHRVSFARVREKWSVLESVDTPPSDLLARDYALLGSRPSGRRVLEFTPSGQAVYDALFRLRLNWERDMRFATTRDQRNHICTNAIVHMQRIATAHPRNPWAKVFVFLQADDYGLITRNYLQLAIDALDLFNDLFENEPEKALPKNHQCGTKVDNATFHLLLQLGPTFAEECGKKRLAGRFRALERKVAINEPDAYV